MSVQTRYIKAVASGGGESITPLNTSGLFKTGAEVSYLAQDDGQFQFGSGVDFFTLDFNNGFGNTNRFTDNLGTQIFANGIVIDWSTWNVGGATVRAYYNIANPAALLSTQLNNQPYTRASFAGWYVCNYKELVNIFNLGVFRNFLNYPPFNYEVNPSVATTRVWTSTMDSVSFNLAYNGTAINTSNLSFQHVALLTREFTLTELGL
jgi:hypothetical protein